MGYIKHVHKIEDTRTSSSSDAHRGIANGAFKPFVLIYDPNGIFTPEVASFGVMDMKRGLRVSTFDNGTLFRYEGRIVEVYRGNVIYQDDGTKVIF